MQNLNHKLYCDLSNIYCQPNRLYHNISHINHCLGEFEEFSYRNPSIFFLKREVFYALWFHDIMYNIYSKYNEENSVDFFKQCAKEYDFSVDEELVSNLILGTKRHEIISSANSLEHNIVNDIDYAILGQSKEIYISYVDSIKLEYKNLSKEVFNKERKKFLQTLLNEERIYKMNYFRDKYEKKARHNIQFELRVFLQS